MDLKALVLDTDPLALFALGGLVSVLVVTFALVAFVMMKLPKRGAR